MSSLNINKEKLTKFFQNISNKLTSKSENNKVSEIIKNISPEDLQKIKEILSKKEETAKILSTPKAQEILKEISKET